MSTTANSTRELRETATEMKRLLKKSHRQLLEVEVALADAEVANGKAKRYSSAKEFIKSL